MNQQRLGLIDISYELLADEGFWALFCQYVKPIEIVGRFATYCTYLMESDLFEPGRNSYTIMAVRNPDETLTVTARKY